MKKLFLILLSLGLIYSASAQKFKSGGSYYVRPRVVAPVPVYPPYYYPYYGYAYSPFTMGFGFGYGYPYYGYHQPYRPSKLDLKIEDIKKDYQDKINAVKMDKSLTGKERRQEVRNLKQERDQAVIDARKNYYHAPKKTDDNS